MLLSPYWCEGISASRPYRCCRKSEWHLSAPPLATNNNSY